MLIDHWPFPWALWRFVGWWVSLQMILQQSVSNHESHWEFVTTQRNQLIVWNILCLWKHKLAWYLCYSTLYLYCPIMGDLAINMKQSQCVRSCMCMQLCQAPWSLRSAKSSSLLKIGKTDIIETGIYLVLLERYQQCILYRRPGISSMNN